MGFSDNDILFVQPTRIVPRKRIGGFDPILYPGFINPVSREVSNGKGKVSFGFLYSGGNETRVEGYVGENIGGCRRGKEGSLPPFFPTGGVIPERGYTRKGGTAGFQRRGGFRQRGNLLDHSRGGGDSKAFHEGGVPENAVWVHPTLGDKPALMGEGLKISQIRGGTQTGGDDFSREVPTREKLGLGYTPGGKIKCPGGVYIIKPGWL